MTYPGEKNTAFLDILNKLADSIIIKINAHGTVSHSAYWTETKSHDDYDLWYITAGRVYINASNENLFSQACRTIPDEVAAGDVVLFSPGRTYTAKALDESCEFIYVHFNFNVGDNPGFLGNFNLSGVYPSLLIRDEAAVFRDGYQRTRAGSNLYLHKIRIRSYLTILLMKILDISCSRSQDGIHGGNRINRISNRPGTGLSALNPVLEYISQNIGSQLKLSDLASLMHVNDKYFIRFFRKQLGITPWQYVTHLKMDMAGDYIRSGRLSIKEIAARLGYPDRYSFSKAFKKYYGIPPASYLQKS